MPTKVTEVEREFIFGQVKTLNIPLRLHGAGKTVKCSLSEVNRETLILVMTGTEIKTFKMRESVSSYIEYFGQSICFTTKIQQVEGRRIILVLPELFLKTPRRHHVRVPCPSECNLSFFLHDSNIPLDYPRSSEYLEVEQPENLASFDFRSLQNLIDSFRVAVSPYAHESRITMFKERKPETLAERLVAKYGKVLFLPSLGTGLPTSDPYPEGRLITKRLEEEFEGPSIFTEGSAFERELAERAAAGILAEIYCPIVYYQYVVGYVYVSTDNESGTTFDFNHVDYIWDFSRFIAFFLKNHGYFKTANSDGSTESPAYGASIIDISVSGCLITIPHSSVGLAIKLGSVIKLRLDHGVESMVLKGRAMRKFEEKGNDCYGFSFNSLKLEDQAQLFGLLYACPFNVEKVPESEGSYDVD